MGADRLIRAAVAACAVLAAAAACSTIARYDAAQDVHAFLVSVRDNDRATFERHVDRDALKLQLRSRLIAEAGGGAGAAAGLGAALAAPLVNLAVDTLVRPDTFRAAALRLGYAPDQPIPSALQITPFIKPLGDGAACVTERHGGPCVLDFRNEAGVWRLSGYEGKLELGKLGGRCGRREGGPVAKLAITPGHSARLTRLAKLRLTSSSPVFDPSGGRTSSRDAPRPDIHRSAVARRAGQGFKRA